MKFFGTENELYLAIIAIFGPSLTAFVVKEALCDLETPSWALYISLTLDYLIKIDRLITDVTAVRPPTSAGIEGFGLFLMFSAKLGRICGRWGTLWYVNWISSDNHETGCIRWEHFFAFQANLSNKNEILAIIDAKFVEDRMIFDWIRLFLHYFN